MKKVYQKPQLMFESFTLSTSIASGCEGIVGNPSKDACGVLTSSGDVIFTDPNIGCVFTPEDMGGKADEWDGFCYHVPLESSNLFNS